MPPWEILGKKEIKIFVIIWLNPKSSRYQNIVERRLSEHFTLCNFTHPDPSCELNISLWFDWCDHCSPIYHDWLKSNAKFWNLNLHDFVEFRSKLSQDQDWTTWNYCDPDLRLRNHPSLILYHAHMIWGKNLWIMVFLHDWWNIWLKTVSMKVSARDSLWQRSSRVAEPHPPNIVL